MQRRTSNQLEHNKRALSRQQKNRTFTRVQLPQLNPHKKPENSKKQDYIYVTKTQDCHMWKEKKQEGHMTKNP